MTITDIEDALQNGDIALENRREHVLALVRIVRQQQGEIEDLKIQLTLLNNWKAELERLSRIEALEAMR